MADCSKVPDVQAAVDSFAAQGGIDILVCNAILPHSPPKHVQSGPMLEVKESEWDALHDLGLKGYFFACQAAAKHMVTQRRGGSLVCLSSVHAVKYPLCRESNRGANRTRCCAPATTWLTAPVAGSRLDSPVADWTVYGTAKAGLERMVRGLACDLARHGIRANCVAPGATGNALPSERGPIDGGIDPNWYTLEEGPGGTSRVASGFTFEDSSEAFARAVPAGVGGAPSDIGGTIAFLCSDNARYINGQTLRVDGGMSACAQLW